MLIEVEMSQTFIKVDSVRFKLKRCFKTYQVFSPNLPKSCFLSDNQIVSSIISDMTKRTSYSG